MVYLIVGFIVVCIIITIVSKIIETLSDFLSWLIDTFGQILTIAAFLALVAGFLMGGLVGVGIAILLIICVLVVFSLLFHITHAVKQHDSAKIEEANIKKRTKEEQRMHVNETNLRGVLQNNCSKLGCMSTDSWKWKLKNYASLPYESGAFEDIVYNFSVENEKRYITCNDDWLELYFNYLLEHRSGASVPKMLQEVELGALRYTHATPNVKLLGDAMERYSVKKNSDVPAMVGKAVMDDGTTIYMPSKYLIHLKGRDDKQPENGIKQEFDINDL